MAISFAGTSGHNINFGSAASLDNLSAFTFVLWIYPKAIDQNAGLVAKGTAGGGNRRTLEFRDSIVNTAIFCLIDGSTSDAAAETTAAVYAANTWYFIAATWDGSNAPKIFLGTLSAIVAECSYTTTDSLGGSTGDNNANNQFVGAYGAGTSGNPNANIHFVGIWNRVLSLGELKTIQFRPIPLSGCKLFCYPGLSAGTGSQIDWSGNTNTGTLTGGALTSPAPLGAPFGWSVGKAPYVVTVGGFPLLLADFLGGDCNRMGSMR